MVLGWAYGIAYEVSATLTDPAVDGLPHGLTWNESPCFWNVFRGQRTPIAPQMGFRGLQQGGRERRPQCYQGAVSITVGQRPGRSSWERCGPYSRLSEANFATTATCAFCASDAIEDPRHRFWSCDASPSFGQQYPEAVSTRIPTWPSCLSLGADDNDAAGAAAASAAFKRCTPALLATGQVGPPQFVGVSVVGDRKYGLAGSPGDNCITYRLEVNHADSLVPRRAHWTETC